MSVRKIRVGVIGLGEHGKNVLLPALMTNPRVSIAALCDRDPLKAQGLAEALSINAIFDDHRKMLGETDAEAVIVCVGVDDHQSIGLDVLGAKRHVFIEKPPAMSASGTKTLSDASHAAGGVCMVGFRKRFSPAYCEAKSTIQTREFGTPTLLVLSRSSGPTFVDGQGDSFLLDFGIHSVDLIRYLIGEATSVSALRHSRTDHGILLSLENGTVGVLTLASTGSWRTAEEQCDIYGAGGQLVRIIDGVETIYRADEELRIVHRRSSSLASANSFVESGLAGALNEFFDAILEERSPRPGIEDALASMRLYEAIETSVKNSGELTAVLGSLPDPGPSRVLE